MPSRKRSIVEPLLGWAFVIAVIAAVAGALSVAMRPMEMEVTGHMHLQRTH